MTPLTASAPSHTLLPEDLLADIAATAGRLDKGEGQTRAVFLRLYDGEPDAPLNAHPHKTADHEDQTR